MKSTNPVGIFLIGGPGSGKDYVLNNIFSRFDLTEVQVEHLLNGAAKKLVENNVNIVINGALDAEKISAVESILEGYALDYVYVSVTNRVSRDRNEMRNIPLQENKRLEKWYRADKLAKSFDNAFVFNNSINLNESGEIEKVFFASQIEKLLERLMQNGLVLNEKAEPKTFTQIREKTKDATGNLKNACWSGYTAVGMKMKNGRKVPNCVPVKEQNDTEMSKTAAARFTGIDNSNKLARKDRVRERHVNRHNSEMRRMAAEGFLDFFKKKEPRKPVSVKDLRAKERAERLSRAGLEDKPRAISLADTFKGDEKHGSEWTANRQMSGIQKEETDINELFEMQLVGTDEYRKHAISMTPGQKQEIEDAYETMETVDGNEGCACGDTCGCECGCGGNCKCGNGSIAEGSNSGVRRSLSSIRASLKEAKKEVDVNEEGNEVDVTPTLVLKKGKGPKGIKAPGKQYRGTMDGLGINSLTASMMSEETSLEEAVQYHLDNKISFTENVFRPGSDMFFQMIGEAKRLYQEGVYTPADEYEQDLLNSNIGEKAIYEGKEVLLDFPFEEDALGLKEEDETGGKGIGKPFRSGGGGAVYVKNAKGNVIKVNFSQSGMKKRINEPARVRSFVARHHCLTNKDKTSASYWACRWPRYFSNTGQQWW